jgi:prephenate dehydratase
MKIAFLGPQGTFTEEAAHRVNPKAELVPCISNAEVLEALRQGKVDQAVLPRENSIGGTVVDVIDPLINGPIGILMQLGQGGKMLVQQQPFMLCGEVQIPITQCLYLQKPGQVDVGVVYSHPQGLLQCERFLREHYSNAQQVATSSTVAGVEEMLKATRPAAAIAPERARVHYVAAHLAQRGIEDNPHNTTRFLVVGEEDCKPGSMDKTSLCFTVPEDESPGSFDRVSSLFGLICGVNKRLVESRPTKNGLGTYVFWVDLDGHRTDAVISRILELVVVAGLTTSLKVLGSYPRYQQ